MLGHDIDIWIQSIVYELVWCEKFAYDNKKKRRKKNTIQWRIERCDWDRMKTITLFFILFVRWAYLFFYFAKFFLFLFYFLFFANDISTIFHKNRWKYKKTKKYGKSKKNQTEQLIVFNLHNQYTYWKWCVHHYVCVCVIYDGQWLPVPLFILFSWFFSLFFLNRKQQLNQLVIYVWYCQYFSFFAIHQKRKYFCVKNSIETKKNSQFSFNFKTLYEMEI